MQVIHAGETIPSTIVKSVFLAGPTPRLKDTPSWRPEALRLLGEIGYDGVVFVPEARDGVRPDYVQQMQWELDAQNSSDIIAFWIPRDMATMPALTTNTEYGIWASLDPARLFVGAPNGAAHVSYQLKYAAKNDVPTFNDLAALLKAVVTSLGGGAERKGGAAQVPLHIWQTASFQNWYRAQTKAGIELHGAHVYSVELTAEEVASLRKLEADGVSFGVASETERTYPRVRSLQEINEANFVDWATIGILTTVLAQTLTAG